MKLKRLFIITILMFSVMAMHAQDKMFERFSNEKNITAVYISKSLLNMMPNLYTGGADIKGLVGKLEQMEIYTSGSKDALKLMKLEAESMKKQKSYEVLMSVKDGDENVTFYAQKEKDKFKDLIMFVLDPNECTVIRIMGSFTAEDIQKVMDGQSKKK